MGTPIVYVNDEAERVCVELVANGYADYIYSEDTDTIVHSVAHEINTKILKKATNNSFYEIDIPDMLKAFNFTKEQFVDFCILCGCDYNEGTNVMSSKNAYNYIVENKKYKNIDEKIKNLYFKEIKDYTNINNDEKLDEIYFDTHIKEPSKSLKKFKGYQKYLTIYNNFFKKVLLDF